MLKHSRTLSCSRSSADDAPLRLCFLLAEPLMPMVEHGFPSYEWILAANAYLQVPSEWTLLTTDAHPSIHAGEILSQ